MASASTFVWEKAASTGHALMPDNSVPLHMSLVPFKLLPQHWMLEWMRQSQSVCIPFNSNTWDFSCLPSHWAALSAGFHSQMLCGLLFLAHTLFHWKGWCGAVIPSFSGELLQLRFPFWFLSDTHACFSLTLPTSLPPGSFFLYL